MFTYTLSVLPEWYLLVAHAHRAGRAERRNASRWRMTSGTAGRTATVPVGAA